MIDPSTGGSAAITLRFPFRGRWMARNSPADRVPSHGSHVFGTTYAVDFVAVDDQGRTAPPGWAAAFATESPQRFLAFGAPILAPIAGEVVLAHDGESDHVARRSPLTLIPYLLTQSRRAREGAAGLAGNHVVVGAGLAGGPPVVLLAHLRRGAGRGAGGERMRAGDEIGACGNSGNSTQPHVHIQATDSLDWDAARGLPIAFDAGDGRAGWLPRNEQPFMA